MLPLPADDDPEEHGEHEACGDDRESDVLPFQVRAEIVTMLSADHGDGIAHKLAIREVDEEGDIIVEAVENIYRLVELVVDRHVQLPRELASRARGCVVARTHIWQPCLRQDDVKIDHKFCRKQDVKIKGELPRC